ncbi:MAG TPA: NAD(P)H-dependent oxidoreductase [Alphaproteobacteria bacterium]|nr:NAD(P)H-dependent oxidoreductase [Alphaproteobacteria bacterium]
MAIKLLFLAGSTREGSLNKKLAKLAYSLAEKEGVQATYIDLKDFPMPLYDGDLEDESGLPETAIALKNIFVEHDGVFIASPEYNSGYSAVLKNAIDWISRKHEEGEKNLVAFAGKVAAISAASPSVRGGLRGLVPLRMLLGNIDMTVIPKQLALSEAQNAFDDEGNIIQEAHAKMLYAVVRNLISTTTALKQ